MAELQCLHSFSVLFGGTLGLQLERDTQRPHVVQNLSCYQSLVILFGLATLSLSSPLM